MTPLSSKPRLVIISGPDIASRRPLVNVLSRDFEVVVIGSNSPPSDGSDGGLENRYYKLTRSINPVSDALALERLRRHLRSLKPDVVQTFSTKPSVLGRLAARLAGVQVIVGTVPGIGSLYGDNRIQTRLIRGVYERLQKWACDVSNMTIFQNQEDLSEFVTRGLVDVNSAMVIPGSGVDTADYRPDAASAEQMDALRSSLGIPAQALVVTMVSRVIRSKGVCDFAEAARILGARSGATPHFLLVGEPDLESRDALTQDEWELVQRSVHCLGSRSDVPAILGITDVFALPSYYREGVPRALLEAAACGKALISTDSPGCRDVVEDDVTGVVVPAKDPIRLAEAIGSLSDDPDRRRRLGAGARQVAVSRFDLQVVASRLRALYLELLTTNSKLSQPLPL